MYLYEHTEPYRNCCKFSQNSLLGYVHQESELGTAKF